jgi:transposase
MAERGDGRTGDEKLLHTAGVVEKFYRQFAVGTQIGMEATGNCQWFVELMTSLGHKVLIGDAGKIRARDSRQQKHDKRDARLLLQLLAENRFPRIRVASEQKDLRQLLIHRYQLVQIRGASEKRFATSGDEPGRAAKTMAVEQGWTESAVRVAVGTRG